MITLTTSSLALNVLMLVITATVVGKNKQLTLMYVTNGIKNLNDRQMRRRVALLAKRAVKLGSVENSDEILKAFGIQVSYGEYPYIAYRSVILCGMDAREVEIARFTDFLVAIQNGLLRKLSEERSRVIESRKQDLCKLSQIISPIKNIDLLRPSMQPNNQLLSPVYCRIDDRLAEDVQENSGGHS